MYLCLNIKKISTDWRWWECEREICVENFQCYNYVYVIVKMSFKCTDVFVYIVVIWSS